MSVNWQWKNKMGNVQWKTTDGKKINVNVYQGNCLCVLIYEYKKDNEEFYDFFGFFNDEKHLKRCIGLAKDNDGKLNNIYKGEWLKWRLNVFFKDSLKIAELLAKAGFKVELYYKEIK